jgi:hypothetical protein
MKFIDLTGRRFGRFTIINLHHKDKFYTRHWLCRCDCGCEKIVSENHLKNGHTKSCGCLNTERCKTQGNHWTKEEIEFLIINYPAYGPKYCNNKLDKGYYALCHKAKKFGLKFNPKQRKIIKKLDGNKVLCECKKHGIVAHYNRPRQSLSCSLCVSEKGKTEEGRRKSRINSRKRQKNPINRLAHNLRSILYNSFKRKLRNGFRHTRGCFRNLDYTPVELFNYLENIKKLQNNECPSCKTDYNKCIMSIDHIIPLATAQTEQEIINLFDLKNLSLLCRGCNSSKNDSNLQEWNKRKDIFNNCVLDNGIVVTL